MAAVAPTVAVVLAARNGARFLDEQIASVLGQTWRDLVLFVRDDGSTDRTMEIVCSWQERDARVNTLPPGRETSGAGGAFMDALAHVPEGYQYLALCDQDDVWLPQHVSRAVTVLQNAEEQALPVPLLVHADLSVVGHDLRAWSMSYHALEGVRPGERDNLTDLLPQNHIVGCTCVFNAALRSYLDRYPDAALAHDWWVALTAAALGRILYLDEPHVLYRQHGRNDVGVRRGRPLNTWKTWPGAVHRARQSIERSWQQAEALLEIHGDAMLPESSATVRRYARLGSIGPFARRTEMVLLGIRRSGVIRNLVWYALS